MQTQDETCATVIIDTDGDTVLIFRNPVEKLRNWHQVYTKDIESEIGAGDHPAHDGERAYTSSIDPQEPATSSPEILYQVSSIHLKNTSQYFRNTFSLGFSESAIHPDDGKYHIIVEGFNSEALKHVMNIIHVKSWRLPEYRTLEQLTNIVVVVDYYDMQDAVSFYTTVWAKRLHRQIWKKRSRWTNAFPYVYCRPSALQAFVAWKFNTEASSQLSAAVIMRQSEGPIPDIGIPLLGLAGKFANCLSWSRY